MKTLLFVLALFTVSSSAKAQMQYDTCSYLQQYAGEWRYVSGIDTIKVYLRPNRIVENNSTRDRLWGWIEYKKGNTIVESNYQYRFMALSQNFEVMHTYASIVLSQKRGPCTSSPVDLTGLIRDLHQANEPKEVTATFNATGTTMLWKQRHGEGYGAFSGATGMTLPGEFLLIKQ